MKKALSVLLIFAMIFVLCSCGNTDTGVLVPVESGSTGQGSSVVQDVDFDDDNVLFKFAVISDIHMSYNYHTEEQILSNADRYADIIAYMNQLSDGNLDAIMMCGDYTAIGDINQSTTFAQISNVIFNDIFGELNIFFAAKT